MHSETNSSYPKAQRNNTVTGNTQSVDESFGVKAPAIKLPKGGGAIRGIDEKFSVNPATGTASHSVPIPTSPGRSGFHPNLSISYDSGSGNGSFGIGWSLSIPAITRKTDKGIPKYQDAQETDTFVLSGAEDLVPVLVESDDGWDRKPSTRTIDNEKYQIQRYRPRIEGLFARVERWTNTQTGEMHWRSISRDNVTTVYGKDNNSRIFDPDDPDPQHPTRIFSWLISESYDDKGNAIVYKYKEENSDGVDLSQVHEKNRTSETRSANRYLKSVKYGNRTSRLIQPDLSQAKWMFEVVFDYGEHNLDDPKPDDSGEWLCRHDPFSSYRAGFEVRNYRLCQRVLMFHHFPDEEDFGQDSLVRSTDFAYRDIRNNPEDCKKGHPIGSFIVSITQSGYKRGEAGYLKKSLPPLEFEYSQAVINEEIQEMDVESLENLPHGLDGRNYQWVDLDGEGISGILAEQADAWFYKPNLGGGSFGSMMEVDNVPSLATLNSGRQQLIDLAGDGQLDLADFNGPASGFYERTHDQNWEEFEPFASLPNISWDDPNVRFVDLNGDGHADILVTENEVFTWYPSLAEEGFGPSHYVRKPLDEEKGPRLMFADGTQSIYLADISGDGLIDLVRIRNGEVCYWPNLGYGRFGAKVTMDNSPHFDTPDQFDQGRIRLADIDGSGVTDIIYLSGNGVHIYLNESGNRWTGAEKLKSFPHIDNLSSVMAVDLLGNGTACLVWSSPLPGHARGPIRYMNLMGAQKPHLLVKTVNNLGAETFMHYASSTRFYLADKFAGKPWITRLPFPVHVVERVETYDRISRNRFVTRYAYHHGYFDGIEREFRGFGMVDQWNTEEFATLSATGALAEETNLDEASHVPPVLTRTWFHTGAYLGHNHISNFFAGLIDKTDMGEYYREPGLTDAQARELLLDDTVLPAGLTVDEKREACRALKGSMLRQEVYALDGTDKEQHPYTVTEQNFTLRRLQPRADNRHGVFSTHARESISYHYERNSADPRIAHAMTLEVDDFGNILKEAAIGYGRRPDLSPLQGEDKDKQEQTLITYTENDVTNAIDLPVNHPDYDPDNYRSPLPCETRTYELTGFKPEENADRFSFDEWTRNNFALSKSATEIPYEQPADNGSEQKRLIEQVRTLYRKDDLTALLPLGEVDLLALPGESYKLAFTPGLLTQVFQRDGQPLLPNPAIILGGQDADQGGYVVSQYLKAAGDFPSTDPDDHWWIPAGRVFYSPGKNDSAQVELDYARNHFFLPHRFLDPFGQATAIQYDSYDLQTLETTDPLDNKVTAGERDTNNKITSRIDYRVLQPVLVTGPNRNRSAVAFDALGMVVGTAMMGKTEENLGDSLADFEADLSDSVILDHLANPLNDPHAILQRATTRLVYDLFGYHRTKDQPDPGAAVVYALARETHGADLTPGQQTKVQHSFSHSDGFGREIQKKIQAEPGPVPERDAEGDIIVGSNGQPEMTENDVSPRWVGSGWTVFNNKGKPIRQYEPFFTDTHRFEFDVRIGVSPVLFYDPAERVVATLHPNHTYEKVVFNPWRQETWDVNDTVTINPQDDNDVKGFFIYPDNTPRIPTGEYIPTWHDLRIDPAYAAEADQIWPDLQIRNAERSAAEKSAIHKETPTIAYFDSLERAFLTVVHNRFKYSNTPIADAPTEDFYRTQVVFDIEGNQREVIDAKDRVVMRYNYDMLGNRIHQASMEAGGRWTLNDVAGKPIRAWDSRDHQFRTTYDELRRPAESYVSEGASPELLIEQTVYGETMPSPETNSLRGQVVQLFDQAGMVTSDDYDFKGNLLSSQRQLAQEYKTTLDWSSPVPLEAPVYLSRTRYDALNRPVQLIVPHSDQPGAKINVIQPGYNEANLLEQMHAWLNQDTEPSNLLDPTTANLNAVTDIDYDAKGQRMRIEYGNGARTTYEYDPLTFHLVHLVTRRNATDFPSDCPQPPPVGWPGCQVQNLHYTYDPMGNITHIRDDAQQTIYFRNKRVEPSNEYTYDAIYRLIEATGREHLGQIGGAPIPHSHNDAPRFGIDWSANDGNAMGTYLERYLYDAVGNILEMQHRGSDPLHPGWTRYYAYNETSLIEDGTGSTTLKTSNRLSSTTVGNNNPPVESYEYDAHGNVTRMPHLGGAHPDRNMHWGYRDQLRQTDLGGGGTAYYVYDAGGQRVRKVWEKSVNLIEERIYLRGFEIYRRRQGAEQLERETLHIMDDKQRIALIETRTLDTAGNDPAPPQLTRYQFGNHLGTASLELDNGGKIISYEEYYPYGSTSYQAVRSQTETPKRYRYTGKERDEESGLYYHSSRYYAPWLPRWTATDPAGLIDGPNLYMYVRGNPVGMNDPSGCNTPSTTTDERIMLMTDPQLHAYLKNLSPEARSSFAGSATGAFRQRVYASFKRYNLESIRTGVTTVEHIRVRQGVTTVQHIRPTTGVSNVKPFEAWTPRAYMREMYDANIDLAADQSQSIPARALGFVGSVGGWLGSSAELIVHGIISAPQLAVGKAFEAGERIHRIQELNKAGSDEAIVDESLAMAGSTFESISATADTIAMGGGLKGLGTRALAAIDAEMNSFRTAVNFVANVCMAGVPVVGKPQVNRATPGHAKKSVEAALNALQAGDKAIYYNKAYSTATGQKGTHMGRRPDAMIESQQGTFLSIEVPSKTDNLFTLIKRNLKAMLRLGSKSEGLVITPRPK